MNLTTKSLAYFFISKGYNIFVSENDDTFLIEKHICNNCKHPWYMELTECFLCGSFNPYIYFCSNCNSYFSITGAKKKCVTCQGVLKQICINDLCTSNTDPTISSEIHRKYTGVFDKKGSFNIAQVHCINCGDTKNEYITFEVQVYESNDFNNINSFLKQNSFKYDILIIKFTGNSGIKYLTLRKTDAIAEVEESSFLNQIDLSKFV